MRRLTTRLLACIERYNIIIRGSQTRPSGGGMRCMQQRNRTKSLSTALITMRVCHNRSQSNYGLLTVNPLLSARVMANIKTIPLSSKRLKQR